MSQPQTSPIDNLFPLPSSVTIDAADQDAFAAYQAAVDRALQGLRGMANLQKRRNTIWHLAWAEVTPQISQNDVFKRPDCVAKSTYYHKQKDWYASDAFRAVLEQVIALTRAYVEGQDGRELERQREELRERERALSLQLMDTADKMLAISLQEDKWRHRDAAYIVDKASTIGRRALEMSKDRAVVELDLTQLSDEELDALASDL